MFRTSILRYFYLCTLNRLQTAMTTPVIEIREPPPVILGFETRSATWWRVKVFFVFKIILVKC